MRVAALYDIHGNATALDAVLEDLRRSDVDRVVVGGDVFPGPHGADVLAALEDLPIPVDFIAGNGEADVRTLYAGTMPDRVPARVRPILEWVAERLDAATAERLDSWPATRTLTIPGRGPVLFCHATPDSDSPVFTERTPEEVLVPVFAEVEARTVVCGHTHMPFRRTVGPRLVVNPGSVGLPFDAPQAAWMILADGVEFRRTPYSLDEARSRAAGAGYPADFPMEPPGRDVMLDRYAASEIGATSE